MPKISRKRPRDGQEASRSSTQASTGRVIPGDLSDMSISELKNLCRELNFSSTGGRRVLVKRLEYKRNRRTQSTSQASITTNNTTSVPTERESFSADQITQITQTVSQSISSFFDSQLKNAVFKLSQSCSCQNKGRLICFLSKAFIICLTNP